MTRCDLYEKCVDENFVCSENKMGEKAGKENVITPFAVGKPFGIGTSLHGYIGDETIRRM